MTAALGGTVKYAKKREYGFAELKIRDHEKVFEGVDKSTTCWMSHGDSIQGLPRGFKITASTKNTRIAAADNRRKGLYGLQFHREVAHTPMGRKMLRNFLFKICKCRRSWTMKSFAKEAVNPKDQKIP